MNFKEKIEKTRVSVLICSYNAERFIFFTIKSVLLQSYKNIEILILDNNSSDGTVSIIEDLQNKYKNIYLYKQLKNIGPYAGLNYLLDRAGGEYIAILDHDDIWHPEKIEIQTKFLNDNKRFVGCGSLPIFYYEKERKVMLKNKSEVSCVAPHPSLVFRKEKKEKYDLSITYKTDYYFMKYSLCEKQRCIYNIQLPLYIHRVRRDGNNLNSKWATFGKVLTYYKKTKDIKKLFFGILRSVLPMKLFERFSIFLFAKDVSSLSENSFTKKYLDLDLVK